MEAIADGADVTVADDVVRVGDTELHGVLRTEDALVDLVEHARRNVGEQLELFAANTLEYLRTERHLAVDEPDLPPTRVTFSGRHALVVVRGIDFKEDLAALKRSGYLREVRPRDDRCGRRRRRHPRRRLHPGHHHR